MDARFSSRRYELHEQAAGEIRRAIAGTPERGAVADKVRASFECRRRRSPEVTVRDDFKTIIRADGRCVVVVGQRASIREKVQVTMATRSVRRRERRPP